MPVAMHTLCMYAYRISLFVYCCNLQSNFVCSAADFRHTPRITSLFAMHGEFSLVDIASFTKTSDRSV